ncbi:MAG: hypothetical protein AAF220_07885 [Pseudomonadota bacterium]
MEQIEVCGLPERLHPFSQYVLDLFLAGNVGVAEFLRYFSLPNSDYISIAACIARVWTHQ